MGNQFLDNIRLVDTIIHIVRCFEDPDIYHVEGAIDPLRDIDIIKTELLLSDLESLERQFNKKKSDKEAIIEDLLPRKVRNFVPMKREEIHGR